jgi:hypothetical protein
LKPTQTLFVACLFISSVSLTACSLDPVKKESDLAYADEIVGATPEKVMRSLQDRQRRCGALIGSLTVSGSFMPGETEQVLDVQMNGLSVGPVGMARLRMSPAEGGTLVRVGVSPKDLDGSARKKISAIAADPSLPCDY